jgi:hypothetical protein
MCKVLNNANPPPPQKKISSVFIPVRNLVLNYATSLRTYPRTECDRTAFHFVLLGYSTQQLNEFCHEATILETIVLSCIRGLRD